MFTPSVLKTESGYEMWYSGWRNFADQHMGYATSPDGVVWTKSLENPVLEAPGGWTLQIVSPSVMVRDDQYRMWFQGWLGFVGEASKGHLRSICCFSKTIQTLSGI